MWRLSLAILIALAATRPAAAQSCGSFDPDQGWKPAQRERFWFKTQGSRLIRYDWFIALEEPDSTTLLKKALDGFGFIPAKMSSGNRDALPIGFTRDVESSDAKVGLTCAACHTQRIILNGSPFVIEGAATLADFERFMRTLEDALRKTVADDTKFNRFAARVLGENPSENDLMRLKRDVGDFAEILYTRWNKN